jgi:hypothetical protein
VTVTIAQRILAVLFSLTLILGQTLPAAAATGEEPSACTDCDCGMTECCMSSPPDDAKSVPAVPPQTNPRCDGQSALVAVSFSLVLPNCELPRAAFADFLSHVQAAVPLYARHCSYLI